jgi:hypothetical protein
MKSTAAAGIVFSFLLVTISVHVACAPFGGSSVQRSNSGNTLGAWWQQTSNRRNKQLLKSSKTKGKKSPKLKGQKSPKSKDREAPPPKPNDPETPPPKPSSTTASSIETKTPTPTETPKPPTPLENMTKLHNFLKKYVAEHSNFMPRFARASFHDLFNFNPADRSTGGNGCLVDDPKISGFPANNGLRESADLVNAVRREFGPNAFTSGDILSLAGKVTFETLFPCMKLKWGFGRTPCTGTENFNGPGSKINTIDEYEQRSNRFGLTAIELATVTFVAHSIKGSENRHADTKIPSFLLSDNTSPISFIKRMIDPTQWRFFDSFFGGPLTFGGFASDFLFFPSTVDKIPPGNPRGRRPFADFSSKAVDAERHFLSLVQSPTGERDILNDFAKAYEKLLTVGTSNLTPFSESGFSC